MYDNSFIRIKQSIFHYLQVAPTQYNTCLLTVLYMYVYLDNSKLKSPMRVTINSHQFTSEQKIIAACPGIQLTCYCLQSQKRSTDKCIEIN